MKIKSVYLVPVIVIIGFFVLLFFPEPETNFLAYIGTALFLIVLIVILIFYSNKQE